MPVLRGGPLQLPQDDVYTNIFRDVAKYRNDVALVDHTGTRQLTFGEYYDLTQRLAAGLYSRGVKKGSMVAMVCGNCVEYSIVVLAIQRLAAVVALANPNYTAEELRHHLQISGAEWIITEPQLVPVVKKAAAGLPSFKEILTIGQNQDGLTTFSELILASPHHLPPIRVNPTEDVAMVPFSSGTTGLPKGVMLTHRNVAHLVKIFELLDMGNETEVCFLPMFHAYGVSVFLFAAITGHKLVVLPRFTPEDFLGAVAKYKIHGLMLVPPVIVLLTKTSVADGYDLSHLRYVLCGAAPLGADVEQEFKEKFKVDMAQGWGMTESSSAGILPIKGGKVGCVGKVLPGGEIKIVNPETGATLGPNEEGEIWVRGPNVMKGYINNPEATRNTIMPGGWLRTGDVAKYDEDGYFFITDRLKELIKYKAFQVAPAELESVLLTHPAVGDAAVIGVPDLEAGELPRAYIVTKPGAKTTARSIQQFVEERTAKYKWLRGGVEFIDVIPKSASGKILRRELRRQLSMAKL